MMNNLNNIIYGDNLYILLGCLVIGYLIKNVKFFEKIDNDLIPIILVIVGIIIKTVSNGYSIENMVFGGFVGLSSIGMHQSFKNFLKKIGDEENVNI